MRRPFLFYLRPLCFLCSNSTFSEAIDFRIHARNPADSAVIAIYCLFDHQFAVRSKMAARQLPSVLRHEVRGMCGGWIRKEALNNRDQTTPCKKRQENFC